MFRPLNVVRGLLFVSLSSVVVHAAPAAANKPSYALVTAPLAVNAKTSIPGNTLKPGQYSISILEHLKDRYILRVDDHEGKTMSTFIALRSPEFDSSTAQQHGAILWTTAANGSAAMRGFCFPNISAVEYVYPKAEAAALAKLNANSVPAVDPESDGLKPDPKLSIADREIVTLWMLSATRVGPNEDTPAIEAKRFVATSADTQPGAQAQVAKNEIPDEVAALRSDMAAPPHESAATVAPVRAARVGSHTAIKTLPQTGSDLPLIALLSAFSILGAGFLRLTRRA